MLHDSLRLAVILSAIIAAISISPGFADEILIYDFDGILTKNDGSKTGFPFDCPPSQPGANGNLKSPVDYSNGTIFFRAEITQSQPVPHDIYTHICVWQTRYEPQVRKFGCEICLPYNIMGQYPLRGIKGEISTFSVRLSDLKAGKGASESHWPKCGIDWSRPRDQYATSLKAKTPGKWGGYALVGTIKGYDYADQNPDEYYPVGIRMTQVLSSDGQFSGWENYVGAGVANIAQTAESSLNSRISLSIKSIRMGKFIRLNNRLSQRAIYLQIMDSKGRCLWHMSKRLQSGIEFVKIPRLAPGIYTVSSSPEAHCRLIAIKE